MSETTKNESVETVTAVEGANNAKVIKLKKPFLFEGTTYEKIDLNGLENIRTIDLMEVNRILERAGSISMVPEKTLDYAVVIASRVTGLPIEFFEQLPGHEGIKLKRVVQSFLYGMD